MGRVIMSNQAQKTYNSLLSSIDTFFVPHVEANHLNAQDVVSGLILSSINISEATFLCFDSNNELMIDGSVVASLILEIKTNLEMIEKILPLAFKGGEV